MELVTNQSFLDQDSIGAVVRAALVRASAGFGNESIEKLRDNPDGLHDARVATRRLRSYLRTFRGLFDPTWASNVRADLSWYGTLLGAVRDVDVIALRLETHKELGNDAPGSGILRHVIGTWRTSCFDQLVQAGEAPRYLSLRKHLEVLRDSPPMRPSAREPAPEAFRIKLERPWRDLREAARNARKTGSEAHLHALRIRSKELRYASEVASETFGKRTMKLAQSATRVQDRLGSHRDALSFVVLLEEVGEQYPTSAGLTRQLVATERLFARTELKGLPGDLRELKKRWETFRKAARK